MLNRQTALTRAQGAAAKPADPKAKLITAATKLADPSSRRFGKDISNTSQGAVAVAVVPGARVKKVAAKAPAGQTLRVPLAGKAAAAVPKPSMKRPAESEPDSLMEADADAMEVVERTHTHKKRKSEPSDDRMLVDEDSKVEPSLAPHELVSMEDAGDGSDPPDPMEVPTLPMDADDGIQAIEHDDIDVFDADDPQAVTDYVDDIYAHMRQMERKYMVSPRYMANQVDINEKMRAILLDWLVEVHRMFKLLPETLFLAVNLIDRFLEQKSVARDKLQLVGVTTMLVASKYEEIYAPEINDFVYISDQAYTKEQILQMEQLVLSTLEFNLNAPSPLHFLRRYSKAAGSDYNIHTLCKYLIELTIMDMKLLKYPPSALAAASVYIARAMHQKLPLWNSTLHFYTHLSEAEVRTVALEINSLLKKMGKSSLKAIKKKYSQPKFGEVSNLEPVDF